MSGNRHEFASCRVPRNPEDIVLNTRPLQQSVGNIGAWSSLPFFQNGQFDRVCHRLSRETRTVWPAAGDVLKVFQLVQPCDVCAVFLGQDPYPQPGLATGLAFAVPPSSMLLPRSLRNIFDLASSDLGRVNATSDLTQWARQGVLLLNTALTVPEGTSDGHRGLGWTPLITQALGCLAPRSDIAWFMCGYRAKQRLPTNRNPHALVIKTGHPSRSHLFNARSPFSRINRHLGNRSINW